VLNKKEKAAQKDREKIEELEQTLFKLRRRAARLVHSDMSCLVYTSSH